jgi:hypothetical protein
MTNNDTLKDHLSDLVFVIRYLPWLTMKGVKCGIGGAVVGIATGWLFSEGLTRFAANNHESIDPDGDYVPDGEEFLHFSRDPHFSKVEEPISTALPGYAAFIGGGAGFFYGLQKGAREIMSAVDSRRDHRVSDRCPV